MLWLAFAGPALGQAPDPVELAWAEAQQETFPAWEARLSAASARAESRQAWFEQVEGVTFEAAFTEWSGAPMNRPAALRGRLADLDLADVARARERRAAIPDLGQDSRKTQWSERRATVLEAEAAADGLERRLLVEALALLDETPLLRADQLFPIRTGWEARANVDGEEDETAARADRWLRELDQAVGSRLRGAARGAPVESHEVWVARLAEAGDDELAASVLGFYPEDLVATHLEDWWTDRAWGVPVDEAAERRRLEGWIELDEGATGWRVVRREALEKRLLALATGGVEQDVEQDVDPGDQARMAELQATAAQEQADAALASAADERARRRAAVLQSLAGARRRSAELWSLAEAWRTDAAVQRESLDEALAGIDNDIRAIRDRRLGETAPEPDAVYRKVRELSQQLRSGEIARGQHLNEASDRSVSTTSTIRADRASIRDAATQIADTPDPMVRAELEAALEAWADVLDDEASAAQELGRTASGERDAVLRALSRLREQRRILQGWISPSEVYRDQRYRLTDVAQELSLLGPSVLMRVRDRAQVAMQLPSRLTDFNLLRQALFGLIWAVVWIGVWVWTRSQADSAARLVTGRLHRLSAGLRPVDMVVLRDPVARFFRAFVDLLLGWLLVGRIGGLVPELGFVLLVYLQVALYRVLLAAWDLLVVPSELVRPALLVLRREPFRLARRTFRYAIGLLIARSFLHSLLWGVLGLDVVAGMVRSSFSLALVFLGLWALHSWQPFLRARVLRRNQDSRMVSFLAREPEVWLTQAPRGLAILAFFVLAAVVDLAFFWLARERSGVAWLVHLFSRIREPEEGVVLPPLSAETQERIAEAAGPVRVQRPELRAEVARALEQWLTEGRRGLIAVVGDRGAGKGMACHEVLELFDDSDLPAGTVTLDRRLVTEAELVTWLASALDLPTCTAADELVSALLEQDRKGWILRGVHRAWTRQVEGFEAITALLYVLNATSHHHFWVLSMHQLSWEFFASSGSLVDVSVFRTVVHLKPLDASRLRSLCVGRVERAGLTLDTSRLLRTSALGGDPGVEEERGVNLFFRLLAEASQGNPSVAIKLWDRCLHPSDDPQILTVHAGDALDTRVIPDLTDAALFTLVALRIQDELDEDELVRVTNLPAPVIRQTLRDLISRGLVARTVDAVRIPEAFLPAVSRTLRRRHFLHLGAG